MKSIKQLLTQHGWPEKAEKSRGTLIWTASSGRGDNLRSTSASVLVEHDTIRARVRSATLAMEGVLEPHFEATWHLEGEHASLESFLINGKTQAIDEELAIDEFQNHVNRLGVRPKFQEMAKRKTPGTQQSGTKI